MIKFHIVFVSHNKYHHTVTALNCACYDAVHCPWHSCCAPIYDMLSDASNKTFSLNYVCICIGVIRFFKLFEISI